MKRQPENIWRRLLRKESGQDWISIACSLLLLGNYISAGENLDENTFSELAEKIPNEDGVIKAFELAPEGIVTDIYPKQGNEGAFGLDMLQEHERKKDAILARDSGKYTLWRTIPVKAGRDRSIAF